MKKLNTTPEEPLAKIYLYWVGRPYSENFILGARNGLFKITVHSGLSMGSWLCKAYKIFETLRAAGFEAGPANDPLPIHMSLSLLPVCFSLYICMYIYVCEYSHTYMYTHTYIHAYIPPSSGRTGPPSCVRLICPPNALLELRACEPKLREPGRGK